MTKQNVAEQIVAKLRVVQQFVGVTGRPVADAVHAIGVTEVTYYRWRKRYHGLNLDQVEWLKVLEAENAELRRAVSELTLDKLIMIEALSGGFFHPLLRRAGVDHVRSALGISERRACQVLGHHRSTQRKLSRSFD